MSKITIVTPSFNRATFLNETILSVISQEGNFEIDYVVQDGGSGPDVIGILKQWELQITSGQFIPCCKELNFRWFSETDEGMYDAINHGIKKSSGDIVAWLNSDDLYFPWTFRAVKEIFEGYPDIKWISTLKPCHWDSSGMLASIGQYSGFSRDAFLDGHYLPKARYGPIQQESTFWRRSLWEKVGGLRAEEYFLAADFDLWSRFYEHVDLYGVSVPLAGIRKHPEQRSKALNQYIQEARRSLEEMRERLNWRPVKNPSKAVEFLSKIPLARRYVKINSTTYCSKIVTRNYLEVEEPGWHLTQNYF